MTTFNEHDHPRSTSGKFTQKVNDEAPDDLGFYATERRVAVTLTLPEGSTDWDLAEVIDNAWPGADATTYGSFQDLRADIDAGAIHPDGTDGDLTSGNTDRIPGKRVVALFNATSEDDRATITERLAEVFGDDSDITAYDEAAHLFAAHQRGEVDDDGIVVAGANQLVSNARVSEDAAVNAQPGTRVTVLEVAASGYPSMSRVRRADGEEVLINRASLIHDNNEPG